MERLRIFLSPHLKRKRVKTETKDPPQSELEPSTPRSRLLSLSTWAICDSTKAGGKKTLKYGRAHSASRAAVVWRRTWWSCSSFTVVYALFSLKGREYFLVYDNISTLNSSPSTLRHDPLDLSFWSFLTFLHHGIEEIERHLLWKFY